MNHSSLIWVISLFIILPLKAQEGIIKQEFQEINLTDSISIFKKNYSHNKVLPKNFKLPALIALSYYPELRHTHIHFEQKDIKTTMAARPAMGFLFQRRKNRTYKIVIDNKIKRNKGLLLEEVSFNAQIGIIGHELAHLLDYEHKNSWQIIKTGFMYILPAYRRKLEHATDKTTIEHGLGWQVREFSDFVLHHSHATDKYKNYKKKYYFAPRDLLEIISVIPSYK